MCRRRPIDNTEALPALFRALQDLPKGARRVMNSQGEGYVIYQLQRVHTLSPSGSGMYLCTQGSIA